MTPHGQVKELKTTCSSDYCHLCCGINHYIFSKLSNYLAFSVLYGGVDVYLLKEVSRNVFPILKTYLVTIRPMIFISSNDSMTASIRLKSSSDFARTEEVRRELVLAFYYVVPTDGLERVKPGDKSSLLLPAI